MRKEERGTRSGMRSPSGPICRASTWSPGGVKTDGAALAEPTERKEDETTEKEPLGVAC